MTSKNRIHNTRISAQRKAAIKQQQQREAQRAKEYSATKPRVRDMKKRYRKKRGQVHRTCKVQEMSHAHSEVARNRNLTIARNQRRAERKTAYGAVLEVLSG